MRVKNISLTMLVFKVLIATCLADFTSNNLHDFIAGIANEFDNIYLNIKNMRNDIKEISERNDGKGQCGKPEKCEGLKDMKEMLENIKTETDAKLFKIGEKMLNFNNTLTNELERMDNDGRASLKGDKGDVGVPGQRGLVGYKGIPGIPGLHGSPGLPGHRGSKGEKGHIGDNGINGQKGAKGLPSKNGEKGETGSIGPRGFRGQQGQKGEKGEKGNLGIKGLQGVKGQKGFPEYRRSVYFAVSYKYKQNIQLPSKTILRFEYALRNIGNGYSKTTGKFKAPYSGVYLFIFFVEVYGDNYNFACVDLYINGYYSAYALAEASYTGHDVSGGNSFVSYLSAGNEAWLQTCANSGTLYIDGHGSTFTGVLL